VPLSRNLGTLTSWKPLGPSGPVMGQLYFYHLKLRIQLMRTLCTLCERNTCTHFIKQLPTRISVLFRQDLFVSLLSIKEELNVNVGYSDVLYFVILFFSLRQTPPCEVCCSGNRISCHVVWRKHSERFEEPVLSIFRFYCNENCSSEKSRLIFKGMHIITSQGTVIFMYCRNTLKQITNTTPKL